MFCAERSLDFECLESNMRSTLRPRPRRTQVVAPIPEGGGNKERRLLPDFEVLGTITTISILPVLSRTSSLETEGSSCDGEISRGVPLWLLGQPDINPG